LEGDKIEVIGIAFMFIWFCG